jgi:hypothetical protein
MARSYKRDKRGRFASKSGGQARSALFAPKGSARLKQALRTIEPISRRSSKSFGPMQARTKTGKRVLIRRSAVRAAERTGLVTAASVVPGRINYSPTQRSVYKFKMDRLPGGGYAGPRGDSRLKERYWGQRRQGGGQANRPAKTSNQEPQSATERRTSSGPSPRQAPNPPAPPRGATKQDMLAAARANLTSKPAPKAAPAQQRQGATRKAEISNYWITGGNSTHNAAATPAIQQKSVGVSIPGSKSRVGKRKTGR